MNQNNNNSKEPRSSQNNDCAICLGEIEDSTNLNCSHRFCFACITSWTRQRNRCPVCRTVITSVRHLVPDSNGHLQEREIQIQEPMSTRPLIMNVGLFYLVRTSPDAPLFVLQPITDRHNCKIYYLSEMLERDRHYYLSTVRPGTMFVVPEDVFRVAEILEAAGIERFNQPNREHCNRLHTTFFRSHRNHARIEPRPRTP